MSGLASDPADSQGPAEATSSPKPPWRAEARYGGPTPLPTRLEPLAYDAVYAGALAVLAPSFLYKIAKGKYRRGWGHKLGFVPEREAGRRVWIHAVSVGEAVAAGTLADGLARELPGCEVVASTTTPTGQEVARRIFGEGRSFYLPVDFSGPVRRAFARTKPSLFVLMELELWPNLIAEAARTGVPVAVVNGRISDRAWPKYRKWARLLRSTMRRIALFGCQTERYAERFRALGAPPGRVAVTGSLKYDAVKTEPDPESIKWARRELRVAEGERVLLGGSTHRTEELALARAWRGIETPATWRLVIAPRHPERVPGVEAELAREGIKTVRRTRLGLLGPRSSKPLRSRIAEQSETGGSSSDAVLTAQTVVLVDTVGELGRFYHAADLVFVGGSLIPHGGQNPIEPAGLGLPVVFGPHMNNFNETAELLLAAGGARRARAPAGLAEAVKALASDDSLRERIGALAKEAILSRRGARARTAALLRNLLA